MVEAFADWTRRLKTSDDGALNELMAFMHASLLRYTTQLVGDRDAAYDVLQEAFIQLWRIRDTLDPDRSLKAFVYRIVYTRALNYNRMKRRETEAQSALLKNNHSSPASIVDELDAKRLGEYMNRWIAELPPRRQEAFRLSRFEGLSHQEIASVMDLSAQTVTKHIMLALQHLRDRLNAYQASGQGI